MQYRKLDILTELEKALKGRKTPVDHTVLIALITDALKTKTDDK